jgi:hypothetical protein
MVTGAEVPVRLKLRLRAVTGAEIPVKLKLRLRLVMGSEIPVWLELGSQNLRWAGSLRLPPLKWRPAQVPSS